MLPDGLQSREEILPGARIHSRAGLVQNNEMRLRHPRSRNRPTISFTRLATTRLCEE
jgi:hypothetical protein